MTSTGCSTAPTVKSQGYAQLQNHRSFDYELPIVWKGIEEALKSYRILRRAPDPIDALDLNRSDFRSLETDWVYSQSREKYVEFKLNGFPKKQYLQTRLKYRVSAKKVLGGVEVKIFTSEEVENIKADGTPGSYEPSAVPDSAPAHQLLEKIENSILAANQD